MLNLTCRLIIIKSDEEVSDELKQNHKNNVENQVVYYASAPNIEKISSLTLDE